MREMTKIAEKHGSLVAFKDFPKTRQKSRPYRPHDFAEEWRFLKKAWRFHRNGHEKLIAFRKTDEGSSEFYANDPLKKHTGLAMAVLSVSRPADVRGPISNAFKVVEDNRDKPEFKASLKEYEGNLASNRSHMYFCD